MTPITLFFDLSPDGKYFPQSRLAGDFCDLVGKPYLTTRQVQILQKSLRFKIDTGSMDRKIMGAIAEYRRPRFLQDQQ